MPVVTDTPKEEQEIKDEHRKIMVYGPHFFSTLKTNLEAHLKTYQTDPLSEGSPLLVDKFTCEIDTPRLALLLACFKGMPLKVYWESRDNNFSTLAIGAVYKIKQDLIGDAQTFLRYSGQYDFRFYGALPFEAPKRLKGKWKDFNKTHFFLPRFEFIQKDSHASLSIYFLAKKISELWKDFDELEKAFQFSTKVKEKLPQATSIRKQTPNRSHWVKLVNTVKDYIKKGFINKLVLARLVEGNLQEPILIDQFIPELSMNLKENYIFLFQSGDSSFLSFSPEKLFEVKNDIIMTEAIAGSEYQNLTQNKTPLGTAISGVMNSKNIEEQTIVEKEVMAHLQKISNGLYSNQDKEVLDLGYIKHIKSSFNTVMRKFYTFSELLNLFHPTSAVCGTPQKTAKKLLSKLEKFQRGLYAAPCGFFSAMDAEFAVGIRSVLIRKKKIYLFSGAGIINASSPESEWQELNHKLKPFQSLFNFNDL